MKIRNKKTGLIIDFEEISGYSLYDCGDKIILGKNSEEPVYGYTTLKEFNEDWEDYNPKEPLIKDKRIREAVKAWAEANEIETVSYYTSSHFWYLRSFRREQGIDFWLKWDDRPEMIEAHEYTIAELCGEEE